MKRLALAALAVGLLLLLMIGVGRLVPPAPMRVAGELSCVRARKPVEVRGQSLGQLAPPGTALVLLEGFYACNEVRRGDLVALRFGGDADPIAKVVHGVPGDRFALEVSAGGERLLVNGAPATNSMGQPYLIDAAADRMLRGYLIDGQGVIPPDAYLVLGDLVTRTTDSRRFGLVARDDLLGKLVFGDGRE